MFAMQSVSATDGWRRIRVRSQDRLIVAERIAWCSIHMISVYGGGGGGKETNERFTRLLLSVLFADLTILIQIQLQNNERFWREVAAESVLRDRRLLRVLFKLQIANVANLLRFEKYETNLCTLDKCKCRQ